MLSPGHEALSLAWPTAGKRACLAQSVESLAKNAADHGKTASLLIVSDSQGHTIAPAILARIEETARRYGFPLETFGLLSREMVFEELGRDIDRELLEYALLPSPDGAGWGCNVNLSFLKTAGSLLVSTDDDVLSIPARIRELGPSDGRVRHSQEFYPGDFFFYRDREALLSGMEEIDVDILGRYLECLGHGADSLLDRGSLESVERPVLIASPGMYGDSAMGNNILVLELEGRSRERLMESGYEELRYSREVARIPARPALGQSVQLMMTQTGFDNARPLAPFLPYGRNPDGMCAFLTRILYPDSHTAYLDFGLLHAPPEPRVSSPGDLYDFAPRLSTFIMSVAALNRPAPSIIALADRFEALGDALLDASELSSSSFDDLVYDLWSRGAEARIEKMETLLDRYDRSLAAWAADVEKHIEAIEAILGEPTALFGERGCGLSIASVRRHFGLYGRLLAIWPELHARAHKRA
jgi:hypothetical protein